MRVCVSVCCYVCLNYLLPAICSGWITTAQWAASERMRLERECISVRMYHMNFMWNILSFNFFFCAVVVVVGALHWLGLFEIEIASRDVLLFLLLAVVSCRLVRATHLNGIILSRFLRDTTKHFWLEKSCTLSLFLLESAVQKGNAVEIKFRNKFRWN